MHITARQEQFSKSAAFAIASRAGCAVSLRNVDDDSVDVTFCSKLFPRRPAIDAQLKCTSLEMLHEHEVRFPLVIKNYNDLRITDLMTPRILIVMIVPADLGEWVDQNEDRLILQHCSYWTSLRAFPPTTNTSTQTVHIPRTNLFTPDSLNWMMGQVDENVNL